MHQHVALRHINDEDFVHILDYSVAQHGNLIIWENLSWIYFLIFHQEIFKTKIIFRHFHFRSQPFALWYGISFDTLKMFNSSIFKYTTP